MKVYVVLCMTSEYPAICMRQDEQKWGVFANKEDADKLAEYMRRVFRGDKYEVHPTEVVQ